MSPLVALSLLVGVIHSVAGTEYLIAFPKSIGKVQVTGTAGNKRGSFTFGLHNPNENFTYNLRSYSHKYFSTITQTENFKIENRTISIYADDDVSIYGYYQYGAFSPLPVSLLGKNYILPFCGQSAVVVIANHGVPSDAQITFRLRTAVTYAGKSYVDGDILAVHLGPYQTYTMSFSFNLLGTTIKTTEDVAVFMGTTYNSYITSFDQLSPVKMHGYDYIVPVDNSTNGYQLHILSSYPENSITFGNGKSIKEPFHQQSISNDTLAFNTTHPSMVVICRKASYNSGFMVIPSTSYYKPPKSRIVFYPLVGIPYVLKIISQDGNGIDLQQYSDQSVSISWETAGGYQVGSCSIPAQFATSITSTTNFTVLAYHPKYIHTGGYDPLARESPISPTELPGSSNNGSIHPGKEYLIALPSSKASVFLTGAAGMKSGSFQIRLPNTNKNYTFNLGPLSRHKFSVPATSLTKTVTEHKAFIVNTSHEEISIYAHYGYAAFSPLPTSALGTNYILPSCSSSSVFVLSTLHNNTVISLTLRLKKPMTYESKTYYDGDILNLTLHQYDVFTFPFQFDITGTTLKSSEPVAVFMGSSYNAYIISYDQMLPVNVHGQEYVVAVDNSVARFQLQVTSAYSDNKILFNNGTMITSQFFHGQLEANSSLYFTTTRPAMTTLCRVSTYQSALLNIPPVSAYRTRAVSIYPPSGVSYTVKLLASRSSDVNAIRYFDPRMTINWTSIENSDFAVGTCKIPFGFSTTFTSEGNFSVLAFSTNYVNNAGYQIENNTDTGSIIPTQNPSESETNSETGKEYLIALPSSKASVFLTGAAGMKSGSFQIRLPNTNNNYTFNLGPLSRHKFSVPAMSLTKIVTEHKAFIVNTSHEEISIYAHYGYAAFSPLPTSALGTNYILPSCSSSSVLVLSTLHNNTVISLTFRLKKPMTYESKTYYDGDILNLTLHQYDVFTFPFQFDITGATLKSSEPVAVFMGSSYNAYIISYDQMLPVNVHGQEYVVAVDNSVTRFQLQVTSAYSDNKIVFNNGTMITSQFLHGQLEANSSLYFTTTRPAMTTLCRVSTYQSALLTIPPVSAYRTQPVSIYPPSGVSYTVKLLASRSRDVNAIRYFDPRMTINWTLIENSDYAVGTCKIPFGFSTTFTSEGNFSVLAFSTNYVNNAGYQIENNTDTGSIIPTQNPSESETDSETGKEYLIALPSSKASVFLTGAAGMKSGSFQIRLPNTNKNYTFNLGPLSRHKFSVPATSLTKTVSEQKAFMVNTSHEEISIYAYYGYAAFSPLPTSALGTNYVLPSCSFSSVLVLSTLHNNTVISLTFRLKKPMMYESKTYYDGDILNLTLHQYDVFTFPFQFDITGATLKSSEAVAVFMGSSYNAYIISYDQMLPVNVHGQEYVVAVDKSVTRFQLQVTSAYSDNKIVFNNGTMITSQFFHGQLEANSSLYFTTTRPAMTTLCRVSTYQSALLTIPPVSAYRTRAVSLYPPSGVSYTVKLLASRSRDVNAIRYFDPMMTINWTSIENATYAVGTCKIPFGFSTTFTSEGNFSVLAFSTNYVNNAGYQIENNTDTGSIIPTQNPSESETDSETGKEYLIALPSSKASVFLTGAAGMKSGSFQIRLPNTNKNYTFNLGPLSRHKFSVPATSLAKTVTEHKAFIVNTSHEEISIYAHYGYAAFSPLPTSALGTNYILPSCSSSSVLVLSTLHNNTVISLTFRLKKPMTYESKTYYDGDILNLTLHQYDVFTFPFQFDITGTTLKSSKPVAVFMGSSYNAYIISYDQMLPVNVHGQEYVVAVDNSVARFQLQVTSAYSDNKIVFNNGTMITSQFFHGQLEANSSLYFTTTRPAMTTLCRVSTYQSALLTIPPVSAYRTRAVSIYPPSGVSYTVKLLASRSRDVNAIRYFDPMMTINWTSIENATYAVGTCKIPFGFSTAFTSEGNFSVLAFSTNYVNNAGYQIENNTDTGSIIPTQNPSESETDSETGKEYLIALPSSKASVFLTGAAGMKSGSFQIQLPNTNNNYTFNLGPLSRHKFSVPATSLTKTVTEHKAFIVNTSHEEISIYAHYGYAAFSPLPTSALGTNYILPSCSSSSVLVLSTLHNNTVISLTFRLKKPMTYESKTYYDGDILNLTLHQYDVFTFPFQFDITGTTLKSSEPVAVFMGSSYNAYIISYDQMLPVNVHGQEYVVAVDNSVARFQLQVTSAYSDNKIVFNNGTMITSQFFHGQLEANSSLYFTTTRPAMTTLCRVSTYQSALLTIPPVSAYRTRAVSIYPPSGVSYTVKLLASRSRDVNAIRYFDARMTINWTSIENSDYAVGTCKIPFGFSTTFTSEGNFSVLAFSTNYVNNAGYQIENNTDTGSIIPTQNPSESETDSETGKEYLIALPSSKASVFLTGAAGMKSGSFQIRLPNTNKNYTFNLGPLSRHKFSVPAMSLTKIVTEHKAFIVNTSHEEISIYAHYGYAAFSPLPTSALGTNYVLPSCSSSSVLVLSTLHNNTVISLTFRLKKPMAYESKTYYDGDILNLTLHQYDVFTFPFQFDITGTTLKSSEPVAVFMGSSYNAYIISYDQMLPVNVHGQEYVVAVDNSVARFQLQVTSAYSDNKIVFNNGTMITSQFFHGQLEANSSLYFTTTRPAMATLCRVSTYQSALLTIPPVSAYRTRAVSIYPPSGVSYTVKLLASRSRDVNAIRYFDPMMTINWTSIENATYAVGTCKIPFGFSTTFTSEGNFSVLAFSTNYVNNAGFSFDESSKPGIPPTASPSLSEGQEYLIVLPQSVGGVYITGAAGSKPGYFQILFPYLNNNHTFDLGPFSRHKFTFPKAVLTQSGNGLSLKAIYVRTSHEEISIYAHHDYAAFSPLPVSALRTKYILPFCGQASLLLIVGTQDTAVQITLRLKRAITLMGTVYHDGDHFSVSLLKDQVFRMDYSYDVTGTTVESPQPIAVFIGTSYNGYITSYDQLPPAVSYGSEFIVAVDNSSDRYQLRTVSEHIDTELTFSNGTTVRAQYLERMLPGSSVVSFNSSRPVLVLLCSVATYYSGFTIVSDVTSYSAKNVNLYPPTGINYIMKILTDGKALVNVRRYFNPSVPIDWQSVPDTEFKVGTCFIPAQYSSTVSSDTGFIVFAYTSRYFHSGPYRNVSTDQLPIATVSTISSDPPNSNTVANSPTTKIPGTNAPLTQSQVTNIPVTNDEITNKPVSYHTVTNNKETNTPVTYNPMTYNPMTYSPMTNSPVSKSTMTVKPETNNNETSKPVTSMEMTSNQVTNSPMTIKPETINTETNKPVTSTAMTYNPVTKYLMTYTPVKNTSVTNKPAPENPSANSNISSTTTTTTCPNVDNEIEGVDNTIPMIAGLVIGVIIIILLIVIIQRLYRRKRANSSIPFRMSAEFDFGKSKETLL